MANPSKPQSGESVLKDILATLKPGEEPTPAQRAAQKALSEYQLRKQEMGASVKESVVSNVSLEKEMRKTNILLTRLVSSTSTYQENQKEQTDRMLKVLNSIKDGLFGEDYREAQKVKRLAATGQEENKNVKPGEPGGGLFDSLFGSMAGGMAGGLLGRFVSFLPAFLKGPVLKFGLIGGMASIIYSRLSDNLKQSLNEWGINDNTILPIAAALSFIPAKYLAVGGLVGGLTYWLFDKLNDNIKASLEEYGITAGTTGAAAGIAATIASMAIANKDALAGVATVARGLTGLGSLLAAAITPAGVIGAGIAALGAGLAYGAYKLGTSQEKERLSTLTPQQKRDEAAKKVNQTTLDILRSNPMMEKNVIREAQQAQVQAQARHYGLKPEEINISADVSEESLRKFGAQFSSVSKSEPVPMDPGIAARSSNNKREATMDEFIEAMRLSSDMFGQVGAPQPGVKPLRDVFGDKNLEGGKFANLIPPYSNPEAQEKYGDILKALKTQTSRAGRTSTVPGPNKLPGAPGVVPQQSSSTTKMIMQTDDRARKEGGSSTPVIVNKGGDTINNITNAGNNNGAAGSPSREYNPWDNLIIGNSWSPI